MAPADGADGAPPPGKVGAAALLLLADGRFPAGGHAHSGGLEAAAQLEGVRDVPALLRFLEGRLHTTGLVAAAFAAVTCCAFPAADAAGGGAGRSGNWSEGLDAELEARTPSPALRTASRRLGRQLLRVGRAAWPHPGLDALATAPGQGPHQYIALGAVAGAGGLDPEQAALAAAHEAVIGPATAAVRLLGLDPFAVHAALAGLGARVAEVAARGAADAHCPPADLPSDGAPLMDLSAEQHATWEVRLFAS